MGRDRALGGDAGEGLVKRLESHRHAVRIGVEDHVAGTDPGDMAAPEEEIAPLWE